MSDISPQTSSGKPIHPTGDSNLEWPAQPKLDAGAATYSGGLCGSLVHTTIAPQMPFPALSSSAGTSDVPT